MNLLETLLFLNRILPEEMPEYRPRAARFPREEFSAEQDRLLSEERMRRAEDCPAGSWPEYDITPHLKSGRLCPAVVEYRRTRGKRNGLDYRAAKGGRLYRGASAG